MESLQILEEDDDGETVNPVEIWKNPLLPCLPQDSSSSSSTAIQPSERRTIALLRR